jgi:hypothetical protein
MERSNSSCIVDVVCAELPSIDLIVVDFKSSSYILSVVVFRNTLCKNTRNLSIFKSQSKFIESILEKPRCVVLGCESYLVRMSLEVGSLDRFFLIANSVNIINVDSFYLFEPFFVVVGTFI